MSLEAPFMKVNYTSILLTEVFFSVVVYFKNASQFIENIIWFRENWELVVGRWC